MRATIFRTAWAVTMTPEKKRLMWLLLAIFFFFANLIVAGILVVSRLLDKH